MQVVHNLIDYPSKYYGVQGAPSAVITFERDIQFEGHTLEFMTRTRGHISLDVTGYNTQTNKITVTGDVHQLANLLTFTNSSLTDVGFSVDVAPVSGFVDETLAGGSVYSKWCSRMFVLDTESDGIEVRLSTVLYKGSAVRVYYKAKNSGIDTDFSQLNWLPFNQYGVAPDEEQKLLFNQEEGISISSTAFNNKFLVTPGLADNIDKVRVRSSVNVDPRKIIDDEWQTLIFSTQNLFKFDAVMIKVVLESHNPALTPLIDDIQIICTE